MNEMYLMGMEPHDPQSPHSIGNCDHFGPAEFAAAAEADLRARGIPESEWNGRRFTWGGQLTESKYFKGLSMGLLRRDGQWVVTAIDRSKTPLEESRLGLREVSETGA